MSKSISIFGLGYVGSVTAACLASRGHRVIGIDVTPSKVEMMNSGRSPIVEAELDELMQSGKAAGRLSATSDIHAAIRDTEISFISVGTPSRKNGSLDLTAVEHVCKQIGEALRDKASFHFVVIRSTVLPGTCESVAIPALESTSGKRHGEGFAVCSNPEFLREGSAVRDFFQPPFTVIGATDPKNAATIEEIYAGIPCQVFKTDLRTAEMVKYVCNTFHALKVAFGNEVGTLCAELGVDADAVTDIYTADKILNISTAYLRPGFAFGGSCLPKDVRALTYKAKTLDIDLPLLDSLLPSNTNHIERAVDRVLRTGKKKVGMLGLSFKAGTDDLRESPIVQLAKRLLGEGCDLKIWDKNVSLGQLIGSNRSFIEQTIPHIGLLISENMDEVIAESDVIVLGTTGLNKKELIDRLRPEQILIDVVRVEKPGSAETQRTAMAGAH